MNNIDDIMDRPNKYDKEGNPITLRQWAQTFEREPEYRRVAETTLPDGKWVSTVWLGIDYNLTGEGLPLIFETMVFESQNHRVELDVDRYSTLEEAEQGLRRRSVYEVITLPVEYINSLT
jgi:hypothetical protein